MAEEQANRRDESLEPDDGALGGGTLGDDVPLHREFDDGTPVGTADADADRARSGAADSDDVGDAARNDDAAIDEGLPVGRADRDADIERSS
jgi:hypothetical protein